MGPDYSNYTDTTIFDKTEEILLHERFGRIVIIDTEK